MSYKVIQVFDAIVKASPAHAPQGFDCEPIGYYADSSRQVFRRGSTLYTYVNGKLHSQHRLYDVAMLLAYLAPRE